MVPREDAAAAAEAARTLFGDPARLEAMRGEARRVAVDSFSAAREADGIAAVYEALWSGT